MKPACSLLLLLSSVLLSAHLRPAAAKPHVLPAWLDAGGRLRTQQLDEVLLRAAAAGDSAAADLLSENMARFLRSRQPERLHLVPAEEQENRDQDQDQDQALRAAVELLKRSDAPPLSIDLDFHILRNMIEMAQIDKQKKQILENLKIFNQTGK